MTRRALLIALAVVAADLAGTRRQRRDDRRCAHTARTLARRGLTEQERERLAAMGCVEVDGQWVSGKVYSA